MDTVAAASNIYAITHVALDSEHVMDDDATALSVIHDQAVDILNRHGIIPADVLRARGII